MAMAKAYEVHAQWGKEWRIESIFDDRQMAVVEARAILEKKSVAAVRVVEEKFNPKSGEVVSAIVFRDARADASAGDAWPKRSAKPAPVAPAPKPKKPMRPTHRLALLLSGVGASGIAVLVGLAVLVDSVK